MTGLVREIVVHDVCLDDAAVLRGTGCVAEVDVACTQDGVAVVLPCGAHLAKETALRTVTDASAGALDPAAFPPVEVALATLGALGLPVVLDLKAGPGEEARTAAAMLAQVPRPGNTRVIGFNHRVVRLVSAQWGAAACGALFAGLPMDVAAMATAAGSGWVVMQSRFLEPGLCSELRARGIRTMTFSASTQKRWEEALASGADSAMAELEIATAAAGGTSTTGGRVEPGSPAEPSGEHTDASGCHRPQ
ncbi:glycerophosphodiester phosphodiesterase [Streptomyces sp. NPDC096136]|uniref:glycerophosphodiester phosphodiesterase n=1 Tax=Streptomyces sp. NPDC096136 TaxID=3366076 RepID=UPI003807308F